MIDISEIKKITKDYNIITFDVFDTLIIRDVRKPTELFRFCYGFFGRYIRVLSEIIARKFADNGEVTLEDIQKFFPLNIQKEIKFEYEYCRANLPMLELYRELKAEGKKIYAISDMYLSSEIIGNILKECGFEIPIIVSCENNCNKVNGELFKVFKEKFNFTDEKILHIGDNEISDWKGAKLAGFDSLIIKKNTNNLLYSKLTFKNSELLSFINHNVGEIDNRSERIGYEIIGPLVLSFCQWINTKNIKYGFDRLFFLARDMRFIYEEYKKIYEDDINYLCVSREAFRNARLHRQSFENYLKKNKCFGNVAIVDTGWVGTAQVEIEKYAKGIDKKSEIGGLYFGKNLAFCLRKRSKKSSAFLFSSLGDQLSSQLSSGFLESLIGTNEMRVINYNDDGDPIYDRNICTIPYDKVKIGASRFISDWVTIKNNKKINPRSSKFAFKRLFKFPHEEEIDALIQLEYEDVVKSNIITFDKTVNYLKNPRLWLKHLSQSPWKGGFFRYSFRHYKLLLHLYIVLNTLRNIFVDILNIAKDNFD